MIGMEGMEREKALVESEFFNVRFLFVFYSKLKVLPEL